MTDVLIYTKSYCPYCRNAKALLDAKGVAYTEIDLHDRPEKIDEMIVRSGGRRTVPQIFVRSAHLGGAEELFALESSGELDVLLNLAEAA